MNITLCLTVTVGPPCILFNQGQVIKLYYHFLGTSPYLAFFFTLHDDRVIAKFLHECFAHRAILLESVLEVPQH